MRVQLHSLVINSFKGIKSFTASFDGADATITGDNGSGKTTVYDAFLFLLFDKDSTGRKSFEVRPLDKNNNPIPKVVVSVEATISFDGVVHSFIKENHEKRVKGQLRGYETLCKIDDVPKKVGEFADYIKELIPEDTFKLLTDLRFFNDKMHWTDRRDVLLDIAGEIGTPEGFDELLAAINGRKIEDYKSVLAAQKKKLEKERDEITPRIDEIQRGLDDYITTGEKEESFDLARNSLKAKIQKLDGQRQKLFDTEKARQSQIDNLNAFKSMKTKRETELDNDVSAVSKYYDEKADIEKQVQEKKRAVNQVKSDIEAKERSLKNEQDTLTSCTNRRNQIAQEYKTLSAIDYSGETCQACGQVLPQNKIDELKSKRNSALGEINKRGVSIKQEIDKCKKYIQTIESEVVTLRESLKKTETELAKATEHQTNRDKEIDDIIQNRPAADYNTDGKWYEITDKIQSLEGSIGEAVSVQLQAIETERNNLQSELQKINETLAQIDNIKKSHKRIKELEKQEKELSQQIADVEKLLNDIDEYNRRESEMIEAAVNDKFKYTQFKMFNQLLNGGIEPACEAMLNGVPYSDMSTGQKIIVGVDIINVLSDHYELSVPLFVDNAESLTFPLESNSQTFRLFANPKIKKLKIAQRKTAAA